MFKNKKRELEKQEQEQINEELRQSIRVHRDMISDLQSEIFNMKYPKGMLIKYDFCNQYSIDYKYHFNNTIKINKFILTYRKPKRYKLHIEDNNAHILIRFFNNFNGGELEKYHVLDMSSGNKVELQEYDPIMFKGVEWVDME